jgi:single-stranded DNA-binding protein
MTNVVVLIGRLARPAEARELPSGDRLVAEAVVNTRQAKRAAAALARAQERLAEALS